ncbi:hypothetical protein SDC9_188338 [bioreactor metagenome]|uniref:Uncharacterized protein n=1 Tax=bioreactor metagenome TaxID=1076179 RepID=A0A645HRG7_9ZZZZ
MVIQRRQAQIGRIGEADRNHPHDPGRCIAAVGRAVVAVLARTDGSLAAIGPLHLPPQLAAAVLQVDDPTEGRGGLALHRLGVAAVLHVDNDVHPIGAEGVDEGGGTGIDE